MPNVCKVNAYIYDESNLMDKLQKISPTVIVKYVTCTNMDEAFSIQSILLAALFFTCLLYFSRHT